MNLLSGVDESEEIRKNLLAKSFTGNILKAVFSQRDTSGTANICIGEGTLLNRKLCKNFSL